MALSLYRELTDIELNMLVSKALGAGSFPRIC